MNEQTSFFAPGWTAGHGLTQFGTGETPGITEHVGGLRALHVIADGARPTVPDENRRDNPTPAHFPPAVLTDAPAPYIAGSETSHAAAVSIADTHEAQRARVLAAIVAAGARGLSDEEGATALGLDGSSYRPRRVRLCELRLVFKSTLKRPTASGRSAFIYIARDSAAP
jgi:hypothetical protein